METQFVSDISLTFNCDIALGHVNRIFVYDTPRFALFSVKKNLIKFPRLVF